MTSTLSRGDLQIVERILRKARDRRQREYDRPERIERRAAYFAAHPERFDADAAYLEKVGGILASLRLAFSENALVLVVSGEAFESVSQWAEEGGHTQLIEAIGAALLEDELEEEVEAA